MDQPFPSLSFIFCGAAPNFQENSENTLTPNFSDYGSLQWQHKYQTIIPINLLLWIDVCSFKYTLLKTY